MLIIGGPACLLLGGLLYRFRWLFRKRILGTWFTTLPDGRHVTLQFEGAPQGGTYRQLIKWENVAAREFGHWAFNVAGLRLTMTVSDVRAHPQFGVSTGYWVFFTGRTRITIDGPGKPRWNLRKVPAIPELYSLLWK